MKNGVPLSLVVLVLLSPAAAAGPQAAIRLDDGRTLNVEILDYEGGRYMLRRLDTDRTISVADADIREIDFGERAQAITPEPPPVTPPSTQTFWRVLEREDFVELARRIRMTLNVRGRDPVLQFEAELEEMLEEPGLSFEQVRDLRLGLVAISYGLGENLRATGELRRIREAHPEDVVVQQFIEDMREVARRLPRLDNRVPPRDRPRGRERDGRE